MVNKCARYCLGHAKYGQKECEILLGPCQIWSIRVRDIAWTMPNMVNKSAGYCEANVNRYGYRKHLNYLVLCHR